MLIISTKGDEKFSFQPQLTEFLFLLLELADKDSNNSNYF